MKTENCRVWRYRKRALCPCRNPQFKYATEFHAVRYADQLLSLHLYHVLNGWTGCIFPFRVLVAYAPPPFYDSLCLFVGKRWIMNSPRFSMSFGKQMWIALCPEKIIQFPYRYQSTQAAGWACKALWKSTLQQHTYLYTSEQQPSHMLAVLQALWTAAAVSSRKLDQWPWMVEVVFQNIYRTPNWGKLL